jgi:hypothetical protein
MGSHQALRATALCLQAKKLLWALVLDEFVFPVHKYLFLFEVAYYAESALTSPRRMAVAIDAFSIAAVATAVQTSAYSPPKREISNRTSVFWLFSSNFSLSLPFFLSWAAFASEAHLPSLSTHTKRRGI